jgi:hypothetical protein
MHRIEEDTVITKTLAVIGGFTPPDGSITKAKIPAAAGIEASKLEHQHALHYSQADGGDIVDAIVPIHVARAVGTILAVEATCLDAPSGGGGDPKHFHVDLKKSTVGIPVPATVLTAPIDYVNGTPDATVLAGAIASAVLADGDILVVDVDAVGADGVQGQGLVVTVTIRENAD